MRRVFAFFLFLSVICAQSLDSGDRFSEYFKVANSKILVQDWGFTVHWAIDGEYIHLGVEAKTDGWVGFGIAELASGSMPGSDILMAYYDESTSSVVVKDTHALGKTTPVVDDSEDWQLLGGTWTDGVITFAVTRKLSTGDVRQDREILTTQLQPVTMARGRMAGGSKGQWLYHSPTGRRTSYIDFGNPQLDLAAALKSDPDVKYFDFLNDYTINDQTTQYVYMISHQTPQSSVPEFLQTPVTCKDDDRSVNRTTGMTCSTLMNILKFRAGKDSSTHLCDVEVALGFTLRMFGACPKSCGDCALPSGDEGMGKSDFQPVHLIGFEGILDPETEPFVHHFVLHGQKQKDTESANSGAAIYGWGPGAPLNAMPPQCGFSMSPADFVSLRMQTHYDNQGGAATGKRDRSGVRVYYTTKLRPHRCGLLQLGDGQVRLMGQQFPKGTSKTSFACPPGDLEKKLGSQQIHVFRSGLHMHALGKRAWTKFLSFDSAGEAVVTELNRNDFYDEAFQLSVPVSLDVKPGDAFHTTCVHRSPDEKQSWGLGSDQEMCIDFLAYYPAVDGLDYCGGNRRITELHVTVPDDKVSSCFGATGDCTDMISEDTGVSMVDFITVDDRPSRFGPVKATQPAPLRHEIPETPKTPKTPETPNLDTETKMEPEENKTTVTCDLQRFKIVSAKFSNRCLTYVGSVGVGKGSGKIALKLQKCSEAHAEQFQLKTDISAGSDIRWLQRAGAGDHNCITHTLSERATASSGGGPHVDGRGGCDEGSAVGITVPRADSGGYHISLWVKTSAGVKRCAEASQNGNIRLVKCNSKRLLQKFILTLKLG